MSVEESGFEQAVEAASVRGIDGDESVRAIVTDGLRSVDPVGRTEVGLLLQDEARGRRRPGDPRAGRGDSQNGEQRRVRRLHREERPEAAGQREAAARHRQCAGIRLPDGAAQRKVSAAARAAPAVDGVPVDGEVLSVSGNAGP